MKTEDFINMLEKNLAEDLIKRAKENGGSIVWNGIEIKVPVKKDPWEGVEFALAIKSVPNEFTEGLIYLIRCKENDYGQLGVVRDDKGDKNGMDHINFKPSTESAYIEQLKKEANSKGIIDICNLDISMMDGGQLNDRSTEFKYRKDTDTLYWFGCPIYQSGKWATKLEKRIKVRTDLTMEENFSAHNWCENEVKEIQFNYSFYLNRNAYGINPEKAYHFLADQLESFLNGEQPEAQPSKLSLFITGLEIQNSYYHTNKDPLERPIFNELSLSTKLNLRAVGDFSKYIKGTQVDEESIAEDIMSGKLKIGK